MATTTSPVILDSTGQDIVTQLAAISAAIAAGSVITASTQTNLNGVLSGNGSTVGAKALDTVTLTNDNDHVPTSGVVKSAIDNLLQVIYGAQTSVSVPNNTTTVIDSISLPAGTYLIMGSTSINVSSNTNMTLSIVGSGGLGSLVASRGTADAGGGLLIFAVVTIEASTTFTLRLRHSAGDNVSTVGNKFSSIQLK